MSNSILTIDMITRKALEILENNLVLTRNVNRQYDDSFAVEGAKIGSTLRIRLPDRALVTDGAALQVQDDNEQFTTLQVSTQKHIGVNFTTAELTMDTISKQFKNGMMGTGVLGFDEINMSQSIKQFTTGSRTATGGTTSAAVTAEGATTIAITGAGNAAVVKAGDVFTVADCFSVNPQTRESTGSLFQFVALADVTLNASGAGNITVAPVYSAGHALATVNTLPANSKAVVFVGAASTQYAQNLVYHKDAITFATADLLLPQGVDMASRQVHNGISLRVVRQYDINNDRMPCRIDVLYGYSTIRPQMAVRMWG
jgi:hypothetical protein